MHSSRTYVAPVAYSSTSDVVVCHDQVRHLVVKHHSRYRCRLVRLTPYACSPAIDGSVMTVVVRVHRCLRLSLCSSSDIGGGRFFSTLLVLWS